MISLAEGYITVAKLTSLAVASAGATPAGARYATLGRARGASSSDSSSSLSLSSIDAEILQ